MQTPKSKTKLKTLGKHSAKKKEINMLRTVQVDVADAALNHHRYGLSRILSDGGKPSALVAGKKQKSTAAVMPEGR